MTKIHFSQVFKKSILLYLGLFTFVFIVTTLGAPVHEGHEKQAAEASSETAGAPYESQVTEDAPKDSGNSSDAADDKPWIVPDSTLYKAVKYAGKFHIMFLHFPIAFLIGAAVVQWYLVARGKGGSAVTVMLWFGAFGAVAAATLGWMYAYDSVYFSEEDIKLLFWHRWLGTGTASLALLVLLLRNKLRPKVLAIALTLCAGLVAAAAHFGASLVYGPEFLLKF